MDGLYLWGMSLSFGIHVYHCVASALLLTTLLGTEETVVILKVECFHVLI